MITACDEELSRTECAPIQPASPSLFDDQLVVDEDFVRISTQYVLLYAEKLVSVLAADRNRAEEVERGGGRVRGARLKGKVQVRVQILDFV